MKLRRDLLAGLLRPQGLVGLLILVTGLITLLNVNGQVRVPRPEPIVFDETEQAEPISQQVELVVVDAEGPGRLLPREISFLQLEGAQQGAQRLRAIVNELKTALTESEVWPEGLEPPTVFALERFNRQVVVLDFTVADGLAVTLEQEMHLLESLRQTLRRNGVDQVDILVNGRATETFLGHVALGAGLE